MVASAEFDPVIVAVPLTQERVKELLTLGRESAKLDFKRKFDPRQPREKLEITKDLVAMANTAGGYVIVGVENDGSVAGMSEVEIARLDEATIRGQVESYIGTSLDLFVDTPVYEGRHLGIITILRSSQAPVVFQKDGQYPAQNGKSKAVFDHGDVFVRHGSRSERWNQNDVQAILARAVERERERWLASVLPDVRRLITSALASEAAAPPLDAREILNQDAATFDQTLRGMLRRRS